MLPEMTTGTEVPEVVVEQDAKYWAGRVVDGLTETGFEVTDEAVMTSLAVLDASDNITSSYDSDELDIFLDEFKAAVRDEVEKRKTIQAEVEDASPDAI